MPLALPLSLATSVAPARNVDSAVALRRMTDRYDLIYLPLGAAAFGGAERSLLDLAGGAVARGKRVLTLAEPALKDTLFPALAAERGVDLAWVDWAPERSLLHVVRSAIATFRRYRAPVIHFNISWRPGMWSVPVVARLLTSARLIGSMRAMPDPHGLIPAKRHFGFVPGMRLWHVPEVIVGHVWARALHSTVSINRDDFPARLIRHYGYRRDRLRVIYNGVHIPAALPSPDERTESRRRFGFSDRDFLLCCAGRVSTEKGIAHLVRAMEGTPPECCLAIVGDGPARAELEVEVKERGLADRVRFLGFQADPYGIIGASDVVVVPSTWYEAFGRTVVEAMAYGVPVVASRIGGMGELFDSGVEGLLVPAGDPDALRDALTALARDRNATSEMGGRARALARERYSFDRVLEQYLTAYDELSK